MRRILTIDGGGIRGTFPAAFLAELEQELDRPIGSYFDLIAGTSTGGIIAIGLGMGLTAKEISRLYEEKGPAIFGQEKTGAGGCNGGRHAPLCQDGGRYDHRCLQSTKFKMSSVHKNHAMGHEPIHLHQTIRFYSTDYPCHFALFSLESIEHRDMRSWKLWI